MKIQLAHKYNDIINLENLLSAWQEFIIGKKKKKDVQIFSRDLLDNIVALHEGLANKKYQHGGYESFFVNDPKRRHIHKASVRDRLLHHAIYRILYPFFDKTFIPDSFSCRKNKGLHKALNRFREMFYKVSKNNHHACWVLKCDIKKFFGSIDHKILLDVLNEYISDRDIMWLLGDVIMSFRVSPDESRDDEESLKYCKRDPSTPLRYGRDDKRKTTRKRMFRRIKESPANETLQSYLRLLKHGNSVKVREEMLNVCLMWKKYECT